MSFEVEFIPSGRGKAQCPPDPNYPNGIKLDLRQHVGVLPSCEVKLPYPAPECGSFAVHCKECDFNAVVTAAGRPDDPTSLTIPCKKLAIC